MICALYRHFDADGRLLYVGVTAEPLRRLGGPRHGSSWFADISRIEMVIFPDRAAAEVAERAAIRDECPAYNQQHTFRRRARPEFAPHTNPIIAEKRALADDIERYCEARGIQPTTFGRMAGLGGDFFGRLRDDAKAQRWETLQKAREHMAKYPTGASQ